MTNQRGTSKHFMTPEQLTDACDYIRTNAVRLLRDRPGDVELALELSKEPGTTYTPTNVRALRLKYKIKGFVPDALRPGEFNRMTITWSPAAKPGRKPGNPRPRPNHFLRNNMTLCAEVDQLTKRLQRVEECLRDLGAQL